MSSAAAIAEILAARHREVLAHLLPDGRFVGREFHAGSLAGERGDSLKVSTNGGCFVWADFATDDRGGDLLDLWAAVRCNRELGAAMREAAEWLGLESPNGSSRMRSRSFKKAREHRDLPDGERPDLGKPSMRWIFTTDTGEPWIAVFRYDVKGKKEFRQWDIRARCWFDKESGHPFPKSRPLYNLFGLNTNRGPVLFVEGEKCADAAAEQGLLATTMLGGSSGIGSADFSPLAGRTVYLWADNDEAGRSCMEKASGLLQDLGATVYEVQIPNGKPIGWDLADAVAEGMSADEILSLVNAARLVNPPPLDLFGDVSLVGAPELPQGCLPSAIELFARDEARRIGIDPGVMGLTGVVVAAGSIDDRYRLQPKRNDSSWQESARIWGAFIDETGAKKTPIIKAAVSPLRDAEIAKHAENDLAAEKYKLQEKIYAKALESYAAKRAKGEPCDEPAKPQRPRIWRRIVDDVTLEALSEILVDNPGGVACIVDELSTWFASFDAYRAKGAGRDRSLWLELYNGGPKLYDRVTRGRVLVPNWSACLFGGIQPGPMRRLAGKITDDGLVQRFIVVFGKGATAGEDDEPDQTAANLYKGAIEDLLKLEPPEPVVFVLSPEAQEERRLVSQTVANVSILPDTSAAFRAHLAKWDGLFARLALTFHMVEAVSHDANPAHAIPGETAAKVARFMLDYLLPNAARFYLEILGKDQLEHARWIAGYILSRHLERITAYEVGRVYNELRGNLPAIDNAMMTLMVAGWVKPIDKANGKPPTKWNVDPRVHVTFAERAAAEKKRREEMVQGIREATVALGLADEEDACFTTD